MLDKKTKELFLLASDNFASCEALVNMGLVNHVVFFLAQQTVEKSIKSVLATSDINFPYTHDLLELDALLKKNNLSNPFSIDSIKQLNQFSVESRYCLPDEDFPDAKEVLAVAKAAIDWCRKIIYD